MRSFDELIERSYYFFVPTLHNEGDHSNTQYERKTRTSTPIPKEEAARRCVIKTDETDALIELLYRLLL